MNNFLKKFDYFGVEIYFLYDSKIKYYSSTGGFIFIIFVLISLIYVGCNIKPFVTRKNMTLIFYDKKIEQTDIIDFENYTSRFSYQYVCSGFNQTELDMLFQITVHHVTMNSTNGEKIKTKVLLNTTKCTKNDFYNEFDATYDNNGYDQNLYCPDLKDFVIGGVYQDHIFKYFEVTTSSRKNADPDKIRAVLQNYECRLEINHVDTVVNVYDYSHPIKRYIRSEFSTIKANLLNKMNIFFKVQTFDSYENYLFDKHSNNYYLGYSYFEEYEDDKGYDRFSVKPYNYYIFAKIYLRADLERTIIQRKYMKLTEFAANMSSILYQVLLFLFFVGTQLNKLYSNRALTGNIFQFKDISSENSKKKREVIDKFKEKIKWNTASFDATDILKLKEEIKHIRKKNVTYMETHKKDIQNSVEMLTQPKTSIHIMRKKTAREDKKVIFKKLSITAHFFEVGFMKYLPCIQYKRVNLKNKLYLLGKQKIDYLLDVLTYLKKVQEIEILSNILLDINQINLVHFLAKPSISISNLKNGNRYHHNIDIKDNEIDEYYNYVKYLRNKGNKSLVEERLLSLATSQIDELIKN